MMKKDLVIRLCDNCEGITDTSKPSGGWGFANHTHKQKNLKEMSEPEKKQVNRIIRITDWSKNDATPIRTAAGLTKTMAPRTEETIKEEKLPIVHGDIKDFYKNVIVAIEGKENIIVKNTEVMRIMELMETIFESAKLHQVIYLNK